MADPDPRAGDTQVAKPADASVEPSGSEKKAPNSEGKLTRPTSRFTTLLMLPLGIAARLSLAIAVGVLVFIGFRIGMFELLLPATGADVFIDSPQVYTRERLVNDRFREQAWLEKQLLDLKENENIISAAEKRISVASVLASGLSNHADGKTVTPDVLKERLAALQALLSDASKDGQAPSVLFPERFKKNQQYREIIRRSLIENELDDRHDLGSNSLYLFKFGTAIIPGDRTASPLKISMRLVQGAELQPMDRVITDPEHPCLMLYEFECGYLISKIPVSQRSYSTKNQSNTAQFASADKLAINIDAWDNLYSSWLSEVRRQDQNIPALLSVDSATYREQAIEKFGLAIGRLEILSSAIGRELPVDVIGKNRDAKLAIPKVNGSGSLRDTITVELQKYLADLLKPQFSLTAPRLSQLRSSPDFSSSIQDNQPAFEIINAIVKGRLSRFARKCMLPDIYLSSGPVGNPGADVMFTLNQSFSEALAECVLEEFVSVEPPSVSTPMAPRIAATGQTETSRFPSESALDDYFARESFGDSSNREKLPRFQIIWGAMARNSQPNAFVSGSEAQFGTRFLKLFLTPDVGTQASLPPVNGAQVSLKGGMVPIGLFHFILKMSKAQSSFSYNVTPRADFDLETVSSGEAVDVSGLTGILGISGGSGDLKTRSGTRKSHRILGYASQDDSVAGSAEARFGWIVLPAEESGWPYPLKRMQAANESLSALVSVPAWWGSVKIDVETEWLKPGFFQRSGRKLSTIKVKLPVRLDLIENVLVNASSQPPVVLADAMRDTSINACDAAAIMLPGRHLWRSTVVTLGSQKADLIQVMPDMTGIIAYFNAVTPPRFDHSAGGAEQAGFGLDYSMPLDVNVWTSEGSQTVTDKVRIRVPADFQLTSKWWGWKCR